MYRHYTTDKRTDVWSLELIMGKINSGLWGVAWADCEIKGSGPIMSSFWGPFLKVFMDKKLNSRFFWKYFRVCTEKLHRIKMNTSQNNFGKYFLWGENQFFRAKVLSVDTWRSGPDICFLICALHLWIFSLLLFCLN